MIQRSPFKMYGLVFINFMCPLGAQAKNRSQMRDRERQRHTKTETAVELKVFPPQAFNDSFFDLIF